MWPIGPARTQEKQTEREGPKFEEIIFYSCIDAREEMGLHTYARACIYIDKV